MSAEELGRRAIERIGELRDRATEYSLNVRFRPSSFGEKHIPALTAEEIALQVLEGNALVRATRLRLASSTTSTSVCCSQTTIKNRIPEKGVCIDEYEQDRAARRGAG